MHELFSVLRQVAESLPDLNGIHRLWWRGQSDSTWDLKPSVARPPDYTQADEYNAVYHFMQQAGTRGEIVPSRPDYSIADRGYVEWLVFVQHHGLRTRLLDWSRSLFVALSFVCEIDKDIAHRSDANKDGALWALNPEKLGLADGDHQKVEKIARMAFSSTPSAEQTAIAFYPYHCHPRMPAQHTVCTAHAGHPPVALNDISGCEGFLVKIIIPANLKKEILYFLSLAGIRRSTLFPDLSNLAADIRECMRFA